jgi:hypothetical protein
VRRYVQLFLARRARRGHRRHFVLHDRLRFRNCAKGKTIDEAAAITAGDIEAQLDGYPEKKKDYPERALEALDVAIADYRSKVGSGTVPDYAAMPRAESPAPAATPAVAPAASDNGKLLISLR